MIMYLDNSAAKAVAEGKGNFERSKHIRIRFHQLEDAVEKKEVMVKYIPSEDNLADIFTKCLSAARFQQLAKKIMGTTS